VQLGLGAAHADRQTHAGAAEADRLPWHVILTLALALTLGHSQSIAMHRGLPMSGVVLRCLRLAELRCSVCLAILPRTSNANVLCRDSMWLQVADTTVPPFSAVGLMLREEGAALTQ
jgi:hypothetical protein